MSSAGGLTLWLTGLPCAGKTTIAQALSRLLTKRGHRVEVLDGDTIRQALCAGLGFSKEDRDRNVRAVAFIANLLARNGVIVIVAVVSPYRAARAEARAMLENFVEVYVDCPASECERRDVKGMYRQARSGALRGFTGVNDPYEAPQAPEILLHTDRETVGECVARVLMELNALGYDTTNGFYESSAIPVGAAAALAVG